MLSVDYVEIPAPIDNKQLMEAYHNMTLQNEPIPSTDYVQLSSAMWQFLYGIYGGGPAIKLPLAPILSSEPL